MNKNFIINIPLERLVKRWIPIGLGLAIAGIFFGIFFIDAFVMPRVVGVNRDMVTVPTIKGLPWETGRQKLYEVGLLNEIRSRDYDDKVPEGNIVSQFPDAGSKVKKGRRVAVVLSKGKEVAVIPNVKDMNERQARIELKKRGIIVGKVKKTWSEEEQVDQVIDAFPPGGTTISREMEVDLIISKGPKPTSAEVPNIVGESLSDARKKIEDGGLRVGTIDYRDNPSLLPGTVISQSISPGTSVALDSPVNITVSVIK